LHKRKIAENKLVESSNRIYDLYNNAPCGYHSVGNDNIIIAMNEIELKWLGYTREEVIGVKSIFDIVHEKDHFKLNDFISKVKLESVRSLKDLELCYVRKDGSSFDVMLNSTVNYDKAGKSVSTRTAVLDITELKKSQEKIKLLNVELELNNTQLSTANSELESFSYSVSHDLRAPLRAIDGYCRIILEDYYETLDAEAKRVFNVILSNSKRMGVLIDDLLDFSRVGRKETSEILVDHNKLLDEILTEIDIPAKYSIKIDVLENSQADRMLMKQVWYNYLSNSIKYTSKITKPFIHISSYKENNELIYCIEDNGVGFDEAYKHKLFNVFQRLHHNDEYEGTGVGLAIVYKIINKHNGRVWAESKPFEKTKFYFSIPIQ
jgi:PAS domain S-box-containing protein